MNLTLPSYSGSKTVSSDNVIEEKTYKYVGQLHVDLKNTPFSIHSRTIVCILNRGTFLFNSDRRERPRLHEGSLGQR